MRDDLGRMVLTALVLAAWCWWWISSRPEPEPIPASANESIGTKATPYPAVQYAMGPIRTPQYLDIYSMDVS